VNSKRIAFIALMGALGNILFLISSLLVPIVPGVSLDLSHIPTFIAAIYGGPIVGFLTGLLIGILPGVQYGPLSPSGNWLALIALPIGKSLTGITAGMLCEFFQINERRANRSLLTIPLVLLSYVPECLFTIFYFTVLLPYVIGVGGTFLLAFVLPKAWLEIAFMSFFMAALIGNSGFNSFIANFIAQGKGIK